VGIEFTQKEFLLSSVMHNGIRIIDMIFLTNHVNVCQRNTN